LSSLQNLRVRKREGIKKQGAGRKALCAEDEWRMCFALEVEDRRWEIEAWSGGGRRLAPMAEE